MDKNFRIISEAIEIRNPAIKRSEAQEKFYLIKLSILLLFIIFIVVASRIVFPKQTNNSDVSEKCKARESCKNNAKNLSQEDRIRRNYPQRRFIRQSSEINPDKIFFHRPDLQLLHSKFRGKRNQIELSKLQQEYEGCKKEIANRTDCMKIFARMYKIAADVSEKMEKMKEIFQDSEQILQSNFQSSHVNRCNFQTCAGPQGISEEIDHPRLAAMQSNSLTTKPTAIPMISEGLKHTISNESFLLESTNGQSCGNITKNENTVIQSFPEQVIKSSPSPSSKFSQLEKPEKSFHIANNTRNEEANRKHVFTHFTKTINNEKSKNLTGYVSKTNSVQITSEGNNIGNENNYYEPIYDSMFSKDNQELRNYSADLNRDANSHFRSGHLEIFPTTGETMKASAQYSLNPWLVQPHFSQICFLEMPLNPVITSSNLVNWPTSGNRRMQGFGNGVDQLDGTAFFISQNIAPVPNIGKNYVQGTSSFPYTFVQSSQQRKYFCTYLSNMSSLQHIQSIGAYPVFPASELSNVHDKFRSSVETPSTNIVYNPHLDEAVQTRKTQSFKCSLLGDVPCYTGNQCISKLKWCDNTAHCLDGSDETACTCRSRLPMEKICDGYADCPIGEDEIGCFECNNEMLSCFDSLGEYLIANQSVISLCYSVLEKCDGIQNCPNGKDERDCNIIVSIASGKLIASEGVLYHNHKGEWYPVCDVFVKWAIEACELEGATTGTPIITKKKISLPGPFIEHSKHGQILFSNTCGRRNNEGIFEEQVTYVQCSRIRCGLNHRIEPNQWVIKQSQRRKRRKPDLFDEERIVGGVFSSPLQWPFVVAIFRNGEFHCGGSILSDQWVITAAHCVSSCQKYYFEIWAGTLRLSSYSPSTQIIAVTKVVIHQNYERRTMKNDIALLHLAQPLPYSKWIKPICLPAKGRTSVKDDWILGPEEGTKCTTLGWGAVQEKDPKSNFLREISIRIRRNCDEKRIDDNEYLCAGDIGDGKDAYQEYLYCPSVRDDREWYLAGIVSHGNGCTRSGEFRVYTRVAIFENWIEIATKSNFFPFLKPKKSCPGFRCSTGARQCIPLRKRCDYEVNCLGGEDEAICLYTSAPDVASGHYNVTGEYFIPENAIGKKKENSLENGEWIGVNFTTKALTNGMPQKQHKFICQRIVQAVEFENRCDKFFDCEDGTDENGCSCKDYLKGPANRLVCDGKIDCADSTDEENCGNCQSDQFYCSFSRKCISSFNVCDDVMNCEKNEDEKGCAALTDGNNVFLDSNKQAKFSHFGLLSRKYKGIWKLVCVQNTALVHETREIAMNICSSLGFKGYKSFNITQKSYEKDNNTIIYIFSQFQDQNDKYFKNIGELSKRVERIEKFSDGCSALFVQCEAKSNAISPVESVNAGSEIFIESSNIFNSKKVNYPSYDTQKDVTELLAVLVGDKLHHAVVGLHWPWLADIYVNGYFKCVGVLLDEQWVLAHNSCLINIKENHAFVVALLGGNMKANVSYRTPQSQFRKINCWETLPNSDGALIFLEKPVKLSNHILPVFLPEKPIIGNKQEKCVAIVHVNDGVKTLPIAKVSNKTILEDDYSSYYQFVEQYSAFFNQTKFTYQEKAIFSNYSSCSQFRNKNHTADVYDQGILMCRNNNTLGWFPRGVFVYNNTNCKSFKQPFVIPLLDLAYENIHSIMEKQACENQFEATPCDTIRCSLGQCLLSEEVCDGKKDCVDGEDEVEDMCIQHRLGCRSFEFKCQSTGKCIPKTKFCDQVIDCEDYTDEPTTCSCLTYIKATAPWKICDGIRNCWDKSDESPALCNCTKKHFPCGNNQNECVPREFVCDNEKDCENGEDEKFCYSIEKPLKQNYLKQYLPSTYFGQVIKQTYGIWHTYCASRKIPPNITETRQLCRKLGYKVYSRPTYRLIDDITNNVVISNQHHLKERNSSRILTIGGKYRNATKLIVLSKFSPLHLNQYLTLLIKGSRPIAELSLWNGEDSIDCYRMEIKCE